LTAEQKYTIDRNIVSLIEENQDCTFYLFFPPYSILGFEELVLLNRIDVVLSCKDYLVKRLQAFKNAFIFDFTADETITNNLDNYVDFIHYRNAGSDMIIRTLKDKKNSIDYVTSAENSKKLFMQLRHFDIEVLKSNLK